MDFKKQLQAILEDDPLGLLDITPKASSVISADERLIASFEEINAFVGKFNREPKARAVTSANESYIVALKGCGKILKRPPVYLNSTVLIYWTMLKYLSP